MEERVLQLIFAGLIIGSIYSLIAVGLNLIYGTMRLLNIAHGELIMVGAYTTFWLFTLMGISPLLSLLFSGMASALLGALIGQFIFLPTIRKTKSVAVLESNSLLIFFALSIIFQNAASLLWSADIRGYSYLTQVIKICGVPLMLNRLTAFITAIIISLGCYFLLQMTMLGKAIRALIQDREASQLVGINTKRIYLFSFTVSFAMAGLAGCLISMFYEITPFMGLPYTITAFVVIVLGGLGNIMGSLLGGFLLGLVETIGISITSPGLRSIISYGIFITVILIRPKGIFGRGV
jgi:branched-chain amino acid transport system permease protein